MKIWSVKCTSYSLQSRVINLFNLHFINLQSTRFNFTVWQKIASDRVILDIIKNGLKINFKGRPGITSAPKIPHSEQEIKIINTKIKKLLARGVIIECE